MAVAKRQGREKPEKIDQRKWREWGPQVEQTALLASPNYIGQVQEEEKKAYKKRSQMAGEGGVLSVSPTLSLRIVWVIMPHASRMYFPLFSK